MRPSRLGILVVLAALIAGPRPASAGLLDLLKKKAAEPEVPRLPDGRVDVDRLLAQAREGIAREPESPRARGMLASALAQASFDRRNRGRTQESLALAREADERLQELLARRQLTCAGVALLLDVQQVLLGVALEEEDMEALLRVREFLEEARRGWPRCEDADPVRRAAASSVGRMKLTIAVMLGERQGMDGTLERLEDLVEGYLEEGKALSKESWTAASMLLTVAHGRLLWGRTDAAWRLAMAALHMADREVPGNPAGRAMDGIRSAVLSVMAEVQGREGDRAAGLATQARACGALGPEAPEEGLQEISTRIHCGIGLMEGLLLVGRLEEFDRESGRVERLVARFLRLFPGHRRGPRFESWVDLLVAERAAAGAAPGDAPPPEGLERARRAAQLLRHLDRNRLNVMGPMEHVIASQAMLASLMARWGRNAEASALWRRAFETMREAERSGRPEMQAVLQGIRGGMLYAQLFRLPPGSRDLVQAGDVDPRTEPGLAAAAWGARAYRALDEGRLLAALLLSLRGLLTDPGEQDWLRVPLAAALAAAGHERLAGAVVFLAQHRRVSGLTWVTVRTAVLEDLARLRERGIDGPGSRSLERMLQPRLRMAPRI